MAGLYGHLEQMKKIWKQNRALLKRKNLFQSKKEEFKTAILKNRTLYRFKEATPEVIAQVRNNAESDKKKNKIKSILVLSASVLITIVVVILLVKLIFLFLKY